MKFAAIDKALHVTAETPAEVLEMFKHYGLDVLAHTDALATGSLTHIAKPGRDNGEWFAISATLGADWFAPYAAKLAHWTGYAGDVPMIEGARYPGGYSVNLCHTHIVESARMGSAGFTFEGFIHSADWNGRTAAERAPVYFRECVSAAVGDTKHEREFIELPSGLLKRNPNYLKRYAPHAAASSARVFEMLLQWWIDTHATPGQRGILAQCLANHRTVCKRDTLGKFLLRSYDAGFRVDWSGPLVSLEQFKGA